LALSGSGGFRLAEVSLVDGTDFTALKMPAAFLFFIMKCGVKRCPSDQELANMKRGEGRFGVLACAAKNEPLVLHFYPALSSLALLASTQKTRGLS
jgi:hypothetical protein